MTGHELLALYLIAVALFAHTVIKALCISDGYTGTLAATGDHLEEGIGKNLIVEDNLLGGVSRNSNGCPWFFTQLIFLHRQLWYHGWHELVLIKVILASFQHAGIDSDGIHPFTVGYVHVDKLTWVKREETNHVLLQLVVTVQAAHLPCRIRLKFCRLFVCSTDDKPCLHGELVNGTLLAVIPYDGGDIVITLLEVRSEIYSLVEPMF